MSDDPRVAMLASRVSDGKAIDWSLELRRAGSREHRILVLALRAIDRARTHRPRETPPA